MVEQEEKTKQIIKITIFNQDGDEIIIIPANEIITVKVKTSGFEEGEAVKLKFSLSEEYNTTLEGTVDANNMVIIKNVNLNEL